MQSLDIKGSHKTRFSEEVGTQNLKFTHRSCLSPPRSWLVKAPQCSFKLSDTKLPGSVLIKETTSQVCPITCFCQKQAGGGAWLGNHTTIVFWSKSLRSLLFHISSTSCHCLLQSGHAGATPIIISQNKKKSNWCLRRTHWQRVTFYIRAQYYEGCFLTKNTIRDGGSTAL